VDNYLSMIDHKTGGFFRIAAQLMFAEAEAGNPGAEPAVDLNRDLLDLITLLGRYYQIRDDYNNLVSDEVSGSIPSSPQHFPL
jgi:geranylgeranyl diphosphate synthase type 3